MLDHWKSWIAAFDRACQTDDWTPLAAFLTEDVVYIVAGAPFACEVRGRDAVIAAFQKSIGNFDRKFDERHWRGVGVRVWAPNAITGRAQGRYRMAGKPELIFSAYGHWYYRGDKICLMTDIYDLSEQDVIEALEWLGMHGEGLDPSYA